MFIHPVLVDTRPAYLDGRPAAHSLLLLPTARGPLVRTLLGPISALTQARPVVLATFEVTATYVAAIRSACPAALVLGSTRDLQEYIAEFDPSERLLLIDPTFYPEAGFDEALFTHLMAGDPGIAQHILALEAAPERTKEEVYEDADGRVRRIQRYYQPATWPFASGLVCSLVPIAALLRLAAPPFAALAELRRALATSGIPSHDVPLPSGIVDLRGEDGVLTLVQRMAPRRAIRRSPPRGSATVGTRPAPGAEIGARTSVAPTARLVGPVVLADDVQIDDGAVVIGPTLVGAGAHIGRGAVVAQCLVMPGASVAPGEAWRHRLVFPGQGATDPTGLRRAHVSRQASIVRPTADADRPLYPELKSAVERIVALLLLVAIAPLLAAIALAVKLTSPGPVLFGHLREGRGGRAFRCWKFRTMRVGADAAQRDLAAQQQLDGPQFKMAHDPRVTAAGRWLRPTSLDELPQLVNVMLGQMSFIGPRPSPFRENQICVPWRHGRLTVRPGITGLWQVCRHDREQGDFHQWIEYDLLYVRHMSLLVDLKILLATVRTLATRRPAALSRIIPTHDGPSGPTRTVRVGRAARSTAGRAARAVRAARRTVTQVGATLLAVVGAAITARSAHAQGLGPFDAQTASGWRLTTGVAQTWDSNVRFARPDGPSDFTTRTRAEGARLWRTPLTRVALVASGAVVRFQELRDLDRRAYDVSAQGTHTFSRRASGSLDYHTRSDLTNRSITVSGEGPLLAGLVAARTHEAIGGFAYRATRLVSTRAAARYQNVAFDLPTLAGGWLAAAGTGVSVRQSRATTLAADYEFRRSTTAGRAADAHQLFGTADHQLASRVSARLTVGVAATTAPQPGSLTVPTPLPGGVPATPARAGRNSLTGVGGGTLRYTSTRGLASLEYQRSVGQVFGRETATVLTSDVVALGIQRVLTTSVQVDAAARYAWSGSTSAGQRAIRSAETTASARYLLPAGLVLGVGAVWRRRDDLLAINSHGLTLGLGYAWSQLRSMPAPPQVDIR